MSSLAGDREDAEAAIEQLDGSRWPDNRPLPDGSGSVEASLATLRAAFSWGDVESAHANALRAIELVPPESPIRPAAAWSLATACYHRGNLEAADGWFDEAAQAGARTERWLVRASALAYRSLIAGERCLGDEQRRLAEDAAAVAREHGLDEIAGEVHAALGVVQEAQGDLEGALTYLERGVAGLRNGQPLDHALALIQYARVLQAAGRREAAWTTIAEAKATIDACPDPGTLRRRLDALERTAPAQPREADLSGRELVVLRMLKGPLSERDIGRELYLSHNTIHSHTKSIYRKLGVSSRRQAVQRGLSLGLL
jgi:LuxR family maltose regulon positive regulatory protein